MLGDLISYGISYFLAGRSDSGHSKANHESDAGRFYNLHRVKRVSESRYPVLNLDVCHIPFLA